MKIISDKGQNNNIQNGSGVTLSTAQVGAYLKQLAAAEYSAGTLESYQRLLTQFYLFLPKDKSIHAGTLAEWQNSLLEAGYSAKTVNVGIAAVNGLMAYCGHRQFWADRLPEQGTVQPELTRAEYLRLLSAAKNQGNEKKYLLVKALCTVGFDVSELKLLTVEAVKAGKLSLSNSVAWIPDGLKQELLHYTRDNGISGGPVFVTRTGKPMDRANITVQIQSLSQDAQVQKEKANPRCLKKLYRTTRSGIQDSFELLVEQAYDRLLEKEQNTVGWGA